MPIIPIILFTLIFCPNLAINPSKVHFSTPPPAEFIVQFDLAPSSRLPSSLAFIPPGQLAKGLETICGMALERAMDKHLFGGANQKRGGWSNGGEMAFGGGMQQQNGTVGEKGAFRVRIIGLHAASSLRPFARLQFVVFLQDRPIPAQALILDFSLLSLAEMSAVLHFPVLRIGALAQMEMADQAQWWIVALIASGGLLVAGCGWALLFCWLNICVRRENGGQMPGKNEEKKEEKKEEKEGKNEEKGERPNAGKTAIGEIGEFVKNQRKMRASGRRGKNSRPIWRRRRRPAGGAGNGQKASDGQNEAGNEEEEKGPMPPIGDQHLAFISPVPPVHPPLPPSNAPFPPPNPYWTADQLERIFHVSRLPPAPAHPRPAPPTENGQLQIIGPIDPF